MATKTRVTRASKAVNDAAVAVKELTPKSATDKLQVAKLAVANKLAEIDAVVVESLQELQTLRLAKEALQQEIKDLHSIDVTAETMAALEAEFEAFKVRMAEEKKKAEADHNELIANRAKTWAHEEQDHKFQIEQRDKRDADTFKFAAEQRQRVEDMRLAALTEREKKMSDLEAEVAGLPAKLDSGIKTAVASATEALKQKYEHAAALAAADAKAKNDLLSAQNAALVAQNAASEKARAEAVAVAEKARQELNSLAQAAVNASSGREALKAVQESQPAAPTPSGRGR